MFNIKKTILNLAVLAALCAPGANAQTPPYGQQPFQLANGSTVYLTNTPMAWQNDEWNMESNIAKDGQGNIYIAGTFYGGSDTDLYVKKMNPLSGAEIWTSTVVNAGNDYGRGAAMDGLGNLYVLAMMQVSTANVITVIKFNPDTGQPLWVRFYDSGFGNNAYDLVADASGAYVAGATNNKIAIVKFPADGVSAITPVNFDGGSYSAAYGIDFSSGIPAAQLVVAGTMNDGGNYGSEIWLGKFNKADLSFVWASTYTPAANHMDWGYDEAHAVKTDAAGNIYAAGFYQSPDSGQDIWLGKYDPSGNLVYARTKNGPSNGYDKGFGLALGRLGNVYVTGKLEAYSLNQADNLWLGRYSPSGALLSEVVADKGSELGFDVEVSSWIVSVGGGFQDQYGLLTVSPEQFGAPQQLFAGPGAYTGSVGVSWVFETAGTFDYKIQYSTANGGFNISGAQVSVTGIAAAAGDTQNHVVMGLPTIVNNSGASNTASVPVAGPVYYFKVWTSADGGTTWTPLTNVANSAPNAPYNMTMRSDRGQDSFYVFNSARVPSAGMARDAAGNTFIAYAAGYDGMMQGLALSKIDTNGEAVWTSFYNSTSTNGRFSANNMTLDGSGNIYIAGTAYLEASAAGEDAWLAKFDSAGVLQWDKFIAGPAAAGNDQFTGLALNSLGNVIAAGSINSGGGEDKDMLAAVYSPAGALISSVTFNEGSEAASPTEIYGLSIDGSDNIYAGGYISYVNGTAYDRDAVVVELDPSLVFLSSRAFANANPPASNEDTFDRITGLAFSGSSLYASGIKSSGSLPQFWAARLDPANWAATVWESTHSADGLPAAAYGLKINSGNLYVAGLETRLNPPAGNSNMLLRKYDLATGAVAWSKSVDGTYQNEGVQASGIEVGADGYFYLNGLFNMWGMDRTGQPGVARIAEPVSGITAMTGPKPCSVQLSWVADTDLPQGTTFYVHYATYPGVAFDANAAQYSFFTYYPNFSGSYINQLVPGLEAGSGAPTPGQSNVDSPRYYFKLGYKKPADVSATPVDGSTDAVANTPGTWDRMDRYPNGNLFVMNNFHGEKFPLVRDAAGNIYTAGSFNAWGWNSNTAYVRKFSPAGQQLWTRYYSDEHNNSNPVINALALDASGNLYAAGTTGDPNNGSSGPESVTGKDILLIKYDSSGRMLWQRSYDMAGGNDQGYGLALGPSNVFLAGRFRAPSYLVDQAFLLSVDMNGVVSSSVSYSNSGDTYFNGLAYDGANARVLAVGKYYDGSGFNGFMKVFNSSLVDQSMDITADGGYEDELYAVKVDTVNAVFYLAGGVDDGNGTQDAYLAKYSAAGALAWERTYNSANQNPDEAYGIALDGLGGVYLSGTEYRYDLNQGKNIFFRKYNTEGDLIWSQQLNSAGNNEDTAGGIAADSTGNVFAAVDAAQMGAVAGGYTAPGTYNAGNTANTANTINGAGYFKHTQFSMITTNPRLTVRVNRLSNQGLVGVPVAVMSFNQTGGMDPNGINMGVTDSSGAVTIALPSNRGYFVAISSHSMVPTISEQISDPNANFFVELNADTTKQYYLSYRQPAAGPVHKLTIHIDGLLLNEYVMGEVFINNTGEKVAYSIIRATGTKSTMEIYNLGAAANGIYVMAVSIPARNKALQLFMNGDFPAKAYYEADMITAMSMATGFDVDDSTNPPSVTGLVNDANFSPLEGARVRIERYVCTGVPPNSNCSSVFSRENLTDVSGRYSFYGVPASNTYNLNVGKAGYESGYNQVTLPAPAAAPVPVFQDFRLSLATYTLTGVLKYNGVPLPNATIMVNPDWNGYSDGADSYRYCQYGGCGVRSDARVLTGADGSFTVTGMTDGNARIDAVFEGGWRSLNDGNSNQTMSDNLRVTISSQGATGPASPASNPCRPGRVWVINSSGTCVTANSAVFNIVPEGANTAGQLYGDLTFITTYTVSAVEPLVISTSSPITLMAQQTGNSGSGNSQMGFTSLAGTFTSNTTSYSIILSTGGAYSPRVLSAEWAKADSFKIEVELTNDAPSVRQDISVLRAGSLHGVVKFPDGSNFRPECSDMGCSYSGRIILKGVNVDVNEDKQIDEKGEFDFPNTAPGTYNISIQPQGTGFVWAPAQLDGVAVTEGRTTEVKLQLEGGLAVQPQIYGLPAISTPSWGYFIIGVESGQEMTQKKITELFFSEPKYSFEYSTSTGWNSKYMQAGQYDFYLMMGAKYDPCSGGDCTPSYNQFANFIGRVKGVSIQKDANNPNIGTAEQPIAINILGAVGQARIAGTAKGSKMFTDPDIERIFSNFSELFRLIPAIMLYDTAGDLRGFANGMPDEPSFPAFWTAMMGRDIQGMKDYMAANPLSYGIWGLPPGRYTAVFANPNYPPVAKEITLPDNASYVFNFDNEQIISGSISGVVKSSATGEALGGARVYLKHRTVEKFTLTDSSGAFSITNLPAGIYRLEVSRNGYVTTGEKTSLAGGDAAAFNMYLLPSESKLSGRLFMSKFPAPVTRAGVQLVVYDETLNVESPGDYLPKTEVQTDASGNYEITGVIPGHLYKLAAFYQGKQPAVMEVTAQEGNTVVNDITLKDTPPQITIKVKKSGDSVNKVDVIIKSPKQLISIPSCQYNPGSSFDENSAVTLALVPGPGNTYLGQFTVTGGQQYYVVKVTAGDGSNRMVKEFVYDQVSNAKTEQYIQEESLAGGEIQMDKETEEYSGIELDPGALSYSTATTGPVDYSNLVGGFFSALPSVRTVKTAKGNLSVSDAIQSLMASEIYNMDLSNASANKPFTLTLKYDKERGAGNRGLRICQYEDATGSWKEVPGNYTTDPMTGVVSVDVASLTQAYEGTGGSSTPLGRKRFKMSAVVNGRFVPSAAGTSQSGRFAVFTANPPTGTAAFSSSFEVYNMPNPFNLKSKSVSLSADIGAAAATTGNPYITKGTVIKYNLPAGKTGILKFVLYNLAGEKVRTIDEGARTGGQIYYSEWDGKNDTNQDCASGVYFMLTYLDGKKLGNKAHKMAIIK